MISMPAGTMPAAMISATACPAAATESYTAITACAISGLGKIRRVASVVMASSPSEPVSSPSKSYPAWSMPLPPTRTISPSANTTSRPRRLLVVVPYLRQCTPPEFSAMLPPIEQAIWLDGSGA